MKNLLEASLDILQDYIEKAHGGNITTAAGDLGIPYITLKQWLDRKRKPSLEAISPAFEKMKITFTSGHWDASKEVCFVNAKIVDTVENATPPRSEDYIAAPLVGEVGAGPGYLPGDEVKSWFLVYRQLPAIRYRKNLIAVEIGAGSNSMQPTLNPKDIVLVDRDDRDVTQPGHIMLVMDPLDSSGMIKRVSVQEKDDDFTITYYSDNAAKWPPMMYSLNKDFGGDWDKSIVGRVIWAWQDMKDK